MLVADEVRGPHLVLADAGGVDRVGAGDLAEPLDDVLRGEARRPACRSRAGTASSRRPGTAPSPRSRRWCPASCSACSATIRSAITSRASPTIGTSACRFLPISAGSMSAWITLAPGANESRLPVTRSSKRAPRLMIRSLFCRRRDRRDGAVHAGHAEVLRVAVGERAARHQRGDDRDPGQLGEHAQLLAAARERITPPPTYSTGRRASSDQPGRLADLLGVRPGHRAVAGQVELGRPGERGLRLQRGLGDVDQHRAGPAGRGDVERLGDRSAGSRPGR